MSTDEFDLIIVGAGSGNTIPGDEFADWRVAIVEKDLFGGTCLNRGCIPSKMYVYAADLAHAARHGERYGLDTSFNSADWPAIRDRIFGRIDPIPTSGEDYRRGLPNTTVVKGTARFVGPRLLDVDGRRLTAPRIVLGAGSRPFIPDYDGIDSVPLTTSDEIMRLPELPDRLVIIGGGVIAAEMGHVFDGLGSQVTIINRSNRLLRAEDTDVSRAFTAAMSARTEVILGADAPAFRMRGDEIVVSGQAGTGERFEVAADVLLVATGRVPNSDLLDVTAGGIEVDEAGRVIVDERLETGVEGVWAFGDLSARHQLKHLANMEARVIAHNLRHPRSPISARYGGNPRAVFGAPQVAAVGRTEQELEAAGVDYRVGRRDYGDTAYGWAMEDTESFAKVVVDAATGSILGAHIIGAHASTVIQPLIQAMALGQTAAQVARDVLYIHPALSEVVENVLLDVA